MHPQQDPDRWSRLQAVAGEALDALLLQASRPTEQRLVQVRAVLKEAREGGVTTIQDLTSERDGLAKNASDPSAN